MPRVPVYERQQLPGVRPTPNVSSLTGYTNRMVGEWQRLGETVNQQTDKFIAIIQDAEEKKNKAFVQDKLNQAYEQDREFMGQIYDSQGANAVDSYRQSESYFNDSLQGWIGQLENQEQQRLFTEEYSNRMNRHLDGALSHQLEQTKRYFKATKAAQVEQGINDARQSRNNFDDVIAFRKEVEDATRQQHEDLEGPAQDVLVQGNLDKLYIGVFDGYFDDVNPDKAQEMFDKYINVKNSPVSAKVKDAISEKLTASHLLKKEIDREDFIIAASDDHQERMKMARESDEKIRDSMVSRITRRNAEEKKFREEKKQEILFGKIDELRQAQSYDDALLIARSVPAKDGGIQLENIAKALFPAKKIEGNDAILYQLKKSFDDGEITDVRQGYLFKNQLNDSQMKEWENHVAKGGSIGDIRHSDVENAFKLLTNKTAVQDPARYRVVWDHVTNEVKKGMAPNYDNILKSVEQGIKISDMPGEAYYEDGFFIRYPGYGPDMTYMKAIEENKEEKWLPDLYKEEIPVLKYQMMQENEIERKKAIKENREPELIPITPESMRIYKRKNTMGLPWTN